MAYQNSSPQIVTGIQPGTGKAPISKGWPIGCFCSFVFFFVVGGGLIAAGIFEGGIACIALGAILKFVFWVLLIVWCVQRRRAVAPSTIVYVNAQANAEAGTVQKPQPITTVYNTQQQNYTVQSGTKYNVAAVHTKVPNVVEKQAVMRYCGQCGIGTTTPFCSQCGSQVPL
jgi:hypothetical protein